MEGKGPEILFFLGAGGVKFLAYSTGPGALVLALGAVAIGLLGTGVFCWNKANENKIQKMYGPNSF